MYERQQRSGSNPDNAEALSRRELLRNLFWAIGGVISTGLAVPLLGYLISPALRRKPFQWVQIAPVKDIKVGEPTPVEYVHREKEGWVSVENRKAAWVVSKGGKDFIVFDPRCTHLGCAYQWQADKKQFLCPCHTGIFDIDGRVVAGPPPRPLDRYETKVEGGWIYVGRLIGRET